MIGTESVKGSESIEELRARVKEINIEIRHHEAMIRSLEAERFGIHYSLTKKVEDKCVEED